MSEEYFQIKFIEYLKVIKPLSVLIPKLKLTYAIGKYSKKKVFGIPDFELDILEIDEQGFFHLWGMLQRTVGKALQVFNFVGVSE